MRILKRFRSRKEKEYLNWLYCKVRDGVNPHYEKSPTTISKVICPECSSDQIVDAGYGKRFKCERCGRIFS